MGTIHSSWVQQAEPAASRWWNDVPSGCISGQKKNGDRAVSVHSSGCCDGRSLTVNRYWEQHHITSDRSCARECCHHPTQCVVNEWKSSHSLRSTSRRQPLGPACLQSTAAESSAVPMVKIDKGVRRTALIAWAAYSNLVVWVLLSISGSYDYVLGFFTRACQFKAGLLRPKPHNCTLRGLGFVFFLLLSRGLGLGFSLVRLAV